MAASSKSSTKTTSTSKKKSTSKNIESVKSESAAPSNSAQDQARKKKWMIGGVIVVILLVGVFLSRNYFVVATVNGNPIWITDYFKMMEARAGADVMQQLVTEELIEQEASTQGITVTQEEIEAEIVTIQQNLESQGQDFIAVLEAEGLSLDELMGQIRIRKMIEVMTAGEVEVTDEEVEQFIAENEDNLPFMEDESADPKVLVRQQLESQKQQTFMQEWMASLETEASVEYLR